MTPQEFMEEYLRRNNEHDLAAVEELITTDAQYFFTEGPFSGMAEIRVALKETWSAIQEETYTVDDLAWLVLEPTVAVATYRFSWRGIVNGAPGGGHGLGTSVLRRENEGWLVVHEHLHALN